MRALLLSTMLFLAGTAAWAIEFDGQVLADTIQVNGRTLHLNGHGLRTWSILGVHVYVAGLYLEHPNRDADAIIHSPEVKVLTFRFERDVSADRARDSWRQALANNCAEPCRLNPVDVERFLASVPAVRAGDSFDLRFASHAAEIIANGQRIGVIDQPLFADALLLAFLGPKPGSPELKQDLLNAD